MTEVSAAIRHEDLIIDEETGEILEWPAGVGADRLDYIMEQHREAAEMESAWESRKRALSRAMEQMLSELNVRKYAGTHVQATHYTGGVIRKATVARAKEALQWKVINQEQYDTLIETAAKDLDTDAIAVLVKKSLLRPDQQAYLITSTPRAGYVRTAPVLKEEPKRAARKRAEYEDERS